MKRIGSILVAAAMIISGSPAHGQTLDEVVAQGRETVRAFMESHSVPGFSIAVAIEGDIVWAEAFGLSNVEDSVSVTTETLFRVASISKSLTSAAMVLLAQRGLLDLDAPIQRYVPSFPEKGAVITSRQLGGHLSGIPHYTRDDMTNFVRYESVTHALDKFKERPLLSQPGERFQYSSYGFNLLSAVVEGASGSGFLDFMATDVFVPLGMNHTVADDYLMPIPGRTHFYDRTELGEWRHAPFTDNSDVWAGGGFLSTPSDLVRFGMGLLSDEVIDANSRQILFTSQTTTNGDPTGYGLGWFVDTGPDGTRIVGHGGSHLGAEAGLTILPDQGLVVSMVANLSGAPVRDLDQQITQLFAALVAGR